MPKSGTNLSFIYIYDPTRLISDEIADRFKNDQKYMLQQCSNPASLEHSIKTSPSGRYDTRICIYVMNGNGQPEERSRKFNDFYEKLMDIEPGISVICIQNTIPGEEERQLVLPPSCLLVQNNDNAMLRITNHVLGIISKESLDHRYDKAKYAVKIFLWFLLFSVAVAIGSYFLFPQYF